MIPTNPKGVGLFEYGANTDGDGKFKLKIPYLDFGDGDYAPLADKVRVSYLGYKDTFFPVNMSKKSYSVSLKENAMLLDSVAVYGEHPRTSCAKNGGVYDEGKNICWQPSPTNKNNLKWVYFGAGALLLVIVGGIYIYKTKNK